MELSDFTSRFRDLSQQENETMFEEGLLMVEAIESGLKPAVVKREAGIESGKGARTMDLRLKVARVFGDDYSLDCDWSLHAQCCADPRIDWKNPDTFAYARYWLDTAIAGFKDGEVTRKHTTRTLKAIMKPKAAPDDKPTVWLKNVPCIVRDHETDNGSWFVVFQMADSESFPLLIDGEYELTLVSRKANPPAEIELVETEPLEAVA